MGIAVAAWHLIVIVTGLPPYLLPDPARVVQAFWAARSTIALALCITATEVAIGFVIGAAIGMALGLACTAPMLRRAIFPVLAVTQTFPVFALAPILTLWFGYGMMPKIVIVVLVTVFPVAAAYADGLVNAPHRHLEMARSMGATPWQLLVVVRIPSARAHLATGLRIAAVHAPVGAIIGEWIGGSSGLGAMMIHANGRMKTDLVFAALLATVGLSFAFRGVVGMAARRLDRDAIGA